MKRSYYSNSADNFIQASNQEIFGEIMTNDQSAADDLQRNAWHSEIEILKHELQNFQDAYIIFEYTIPRIGNRIDNVLIYKNIVFLIEFKVGESSYPSSALEQVVDYALDLKCFHKESHDVLLVPILCSTKAPNVVNQLAYLDENILEPICCNANSIANAINKIVATYSPEYLNPHKWENSIYMPTPTIIEAAQVLYRGHNVKEISRNDAAAINLELTTKAINNIIDFSKSNNKKSICFVTGVPGAGKTLAGLNISIERQNIDLNEHAVFLSGNGPLVEVLQEALARDDCARNNIRKKEALRKAKTFIQIIHHFRDDAISTPTPPNEKVAIFDEAQRAWTKEMLTKFMREKKGVVDFNMSEPEFLISIMNRHADWSTIICLIGGGQEINTGEAGLTEWFASLRKLFPDWNIFISNKITDSEYIKDKSIHELFQGLNIKTVDELHLSVSLRSFRSERVSEFVKSLLDIDVEKAKYLYKIICPNYPIYMTRDLEIAKSWIKSRAKGSSRYGLIASSGAKRLRKYGIWVQSKIDAKHWFLNAKNDVRSSYFLEETATEFDIQGLELDWSIVCWDADLRVSNNKLEFFDFKGTKWQRINNTNNMLYLKNAYRVLLTRARQGFIIFIPTGDSSDPTRNTEYYNSIYDYLKRIEITEI